MVTKIVKKPLGRRIAEIQEEDAQYAAEHLEPEAPAAVAPSTVPEASALTATEGLRSGGPGEVPPAGEGAKSETSPAAAPALDQAAPAKKVRQKPEYIKIAAIVDPETMKRLDVECFERRMKGEKPTYTSIIREALELRWELQAKKTEREGV